jgi:hypothetical protein
MPGDALPLNDDEMIARLREVTARFDPVPEAVTAFALAALDLRFVDEQIAALISDSADFVRLAGVRATNAPRLLRFGAGSLRIDAAVDADVLSGRVTTTSPTGPADPYRGVVHVQSANTLSDVSLDAFGEFSVRLQPGPFRIRITGPTTVTCTEWLLCPR